MALPKNELKILKSMIKPLPKEEHQLLKEVLSSDALDAIDKHGLAQLDHHKSKKEIFFHFFGMNKNWKWGRNIAGLLLVHSPEYPTYFLPAFNQAKETGDAHELKKGEGLRGFLTGCLEGAAVGALVSGEKMKGREMVPYILLGAGLQFLSAKVFPIIGEKAGKYLYHKEPYVGKIVDAVEVPFGYGSMQSNLPVSTLNPTNLDVSNSNPVQFNDKMPYNQFNRGSLKI